MSLRDYAGWNEDARYMWWQEEGRHESGPPEPDDFDYHGPDSWDDDCPSCGYQMDEPEYGCGTIGCSNFADL